MGTTPGFVVVVVGSGFGSHQPSCLPSPGGYFLSGTKVKLARGIVLTCCCELVPYPETRGLLELSLKDEGDWRDWRDWHALLQAWGGG